MQLIVEPETTLDLEINMSSDENIQNIKNNDRSIVNLDVDNLHDQKCNGNEQDSNLKDLECEKTKEINEIDDTDVSVSIDNNEAELSKVDLSEIIKEKSDGLEINDIQIEESQKKGSNNNINGSGSVENGAVNLDESKDTLEEDYLEDDIISIVQEPLKEVPLLETEPQNIVLEKQDDNIKNTLAIEEDKLEIDIEDSEPLQSKVNLVLDSDDVVEVIEDIDISPVQNIKEPELQTPKEKDDIPVKESQGISRVHNELDEQLPIQKEDKESRGLDKVNDSAVQNEMEILPILEEKDNIEVIEESDGSPVQTEKQAETVHSTTNSKKIEIRSEVDSSITCDKNIESQLEESKQDDIEIVEEIERTTSKTGSDEKDEINIVEDKEESSIQNNDIVHSVVEKVSESTDQSTDKLDSPLNINQEVQIIEETEQPYIQDENEKDSQTKVNVIHNVTKSIETATAEKTSEVIDTPVVSKDHDMDVEELAKEDKIVTNSHNSTIELNCDMDAEDAAEETKINNKDDAKVNDSTPVNTAPVNTIDKPVICRLSNTLDILSDDDEDLPLIDFEKPEHSKDLAHEPAKDNAEEDDDIMFIDEDTNKTDTNLTVDSNINKETDAEPVVNADLETGEKITHETEDVLEPPDKTETILPPVATQDSSMEINVKAKTPEPESEKKETTPPPLIPNNFVETTKKKLSDMTRDDLEEFCILKIVESIVDRSSLSDIKNKLKTMTQGLEEYRKKAMMLTKQNRDLQVVLKSVQEEQKKVMGNTPITPLKITRSVGMQVYMEKTAPRKKGSQQNNNNKNPINAQNKNTTPPGQGPRPQKQVNQSIPVPRLVPASSPSLKTPSTIPQINQVNTPSKNANLPNGVLKTPPPQPKAEKRPHNKMASSVTVDLTDDEPPTKLPGGPKASPAPPVRLVPPQNLMGPQRQAFGTNVNSPRKVYIPISAPQNQALRPGQTIMLKTVPATGVRPRCPPPQVARVDNNVRLNRIAPRHPAPLPFAMKQYQPPNWKSLPPAPDLKLSKVENGIVISWKIEGVSENSYEEIASYQLYAYQETSQTPTTSLWKKIGDVKALPLPMACTLTQFMAGFKYYFAVRAVDIRSRLGPFSLPGSILLLSKNM